MLAQCLYVCVSSVFVSDSSRCGYSALAANLLLINADFPSQPYYQLWLGASGYSSL